MKPSKIFLLASMISIVTMTSCSDTDSHHNSTAQTKVSHRDKIYVLIEGGIHDTIVNEYQDHRTDPMEYHLNSDMLEDRDDNTLSNKVILYKIVSSKIIDQPAN